MLDWLGATAHSRSNRRNRAGCRAAGQQQARPGPQFTPCAAGGALPHPACCCTSPAAGSLAQPLGSPPVCPAWSALRCRLSCRCLAWTAASWGQWTCRMRWAWRSGWASPPALIRQSSRRAAGGPGVAGLLPRGCGPTQQWLLKPGPAVACKAIACTATCVPAAHAPHPPSRAAMPPLPWALPGWCRKW